jgi:hypothetical protein
MMGNNDETLDRKFKALWDDTSPMTKEWEKLETLNAAIKEISRNLAIRALGLRTLPEINADMQPGEVEMGQLFLETLIVLWNRVMLRTSLKVHDALELMFRSINSANAYGCAIAARSIIEHVALLQFVAKEIPWLEGRVIKHEEMVDFTKRLFNLTQGSTFDWDKILAGAVSVRQILASNCWKRPGSDRIPQIATLVETLDAEMSLEQGEDAEGHLRFVYSALCDVIHPSWGGDFIYAPQIYREIKLERAFDEHFKRIATLFCLPVVAVVRRLGKLVQLMIHNEPRILGIRKDA